MNPWNRFTLVPACLSLLASAWTAPVVAAEPAWEAGFQSPPPAARPRTWWHWVSGNVSAEGITADLEAMKEIGLGGCQLFTVDQSKVHGPVKFMSPEWRGFVKQALSEADRLGLEVSIEGCDGWSESGGPWIKPEQGMQHVVWSETNVVGGQTIALQLPTPKANDGFYRDIAWLAFPALPGDGQLHDALHDE
ncbi:MAG TPA: glycosyl hydrolase, partial [Verrucomicrobiae bacterium]